MVCESNSIFSIGLSYDNKKIFISQVYYYISYFEEISFKLCAEDKIGDIYLGLVQKVHRIYNYIFKHLFSNLINNGSELLNFKIVLYYLISPKKKNITLRIFFYNYYNSV